MVSKPILARLLGLSGHPYRAVIGPLLNNIVPHTSWAVSTWGVVFTSWYL